MTLAERRKRNRDVYTEVYRDYPSYGNRQVRINLTKEWIEGFPDARTFLDVGCGHGEVLDMAAFLGLNACGCDIIPELAAREDVDLIDTAEDLPYDDGSFDLVTCTDVLEHIAEEDLCSVLQEIARVSKGYILLTTCHRPDTPGKYGPHQLHVTVKPREWWEEMICAYMGVWPTPLYLDRVNGNGTWFDIRCG